MPRPRLRIALLASAALMLSVPAIASAGPEECLQPDPEAALCLAEHGGSTAQQAEQPLVAPRAAARTTADKVGEAAGICDPTDAAACLLPFPNDAFTVADPSTKTGRRVDLNLLAMPRNVANKPIDPTEFNRNDGWSPGSPVLTSVPGLSLGKSGIADVTDPGASLAADAPIVLLDAKTGQRHPYWAELDGNDTAGEQPLLIVRPAVNFTDGHRYVVGLRDLKDGAGKDIAPNATFVQRRTAAQSELESRAAKDNHGQRVKAAKDWSDPVFAPLARQGIEPKSLYLAWTFTIASTENITGRMISMRDQAFAPLGADGAPAFTVDGTVQGADGSGLDGNTFRRVTGTFTVPNFLTTPVNAKEPALDSDPGLPGTRLLDVDQDGKPEQNGTFTATYTCNIPRSASVDAPSRGSIYGHGLLGGQGEVNGSSAMPFGNAHNITMCATDWYGMATGDVPNVALMLQDMSNFPTLPDRVQQGMLAQLYLARLLKSSKGFAADPAFQLGGKPLVRSGEVYYDGNSQGGIIGGALMAVAQDITRGALGVPGMNYSTLLDRSVDFSQYESVFNAAYPSETERELVFGLIQMLWDRGEADGYAAHITNNPLPGTPSHQVLMHAAFGDHQVANVAAEVMARTIGAQTNAAFLDPGRHWGVEPGWGIPRIAADTPYTGSAFVYWDSGTATPPNANVPPSEYPGVAGHDPHSDPRKDAKAKAQKSDFLRADGVFTDTCAGMPCYAAGWTGTP
jgi:hypothetical protein